METKLSKLSEEIKEDIKHSILNALTVSELEMPFYRHFFRYFTNLLRSNSTMDSGDLRFMVEIVKTRINTIHLLKDIGDGQGEQNNRLKICKWVGDFCQYLTHFGPYSASTGLLIELWKELGKYQAEINQNKDVPRHIYRAGAGMYLGLIYLQQREIGAAIWWFLLAQADDLLNQHEEKGGAAKDRLRLDFGVEDAVFDFMEQCATKCLGSNQAHAYFAEHIVMNLSLEPEFNHLFAYPTSLTEFPIDKAYAKAMFARLANDPQGTVLEQFSRYLILLLSGWVPTKNLYHLRTDIDSDLVARYVREPESISSNKQRAMLIECKNIDRSMSVASVGYFLYRMHLTQVEVGILFARKNVSNRNSSEEETDHRNAEHLLALAFQRDGNIVIVIDKNDLEKLINGETTMRSLVDSKVIERRFGLSRSGTEDQWI